MDGWKPPLSKLLSRAEVGAVFELAKKNDRRDYILFVTAANTGLRLSEILHLTTHDLLDGALRATRRKKKRLRPEEIAAPAPLLGLLKSWASELKKVSNGWLFVGSSGPCKRGPKKEVLCEGGHVSRREIQRRWTAYLKAAKLSAKGRGVHTLRHYAGTEFYRTHKDLRATQEFLGHSSSSTTEGYAHVLDMAEKVGKVKPTL